MPIEQATRIEADRSLTSVWRSVVNGEPGPWRRSSRIVMPIEQATRIEAYGSLTSVWRSVVNGEPGPWRRAEKIARLDEVGDPGLTVPAMDTRCLNGVSFLKRGNTARIAHAANCFCDERLVKPDA